MGPLEWGRWRGVILELEDLQQPGGVGEHRDEGGPGQRGERGGRGGREREKPRVPGMRGA